MTKYRHAPVDGIKVFYREGGPANAPAILLLHGFRTSSHMFRNLIPALADSYHVVAPDLPASASQTVRIARTTATPSSRLRRQLRLSLKR